MSARVLIVDDSALVRQLHTFMLRSGGFEVHEAASGSEAIEALLLRQFDLVVTDVNMPRMDGLELTRRIRATPGYEGVPVIMVSTEAEARDRASGMQAGANVYVIKPARAPELIQHARMLIGR